MVTPVDFTDGLKIYNETLNKWQAELSCDTFSLSVFSTCWFYFSKSLQWTVLFSQYLSILYTIIELMRTKSSRVTIHCLWQAEVSWADYASFSLYLEVGSMPMKAFGLSAFYLGNQRYSLQGVSFSFLFLFWFALFFLFLFCFVFFLFCGQNLWALLLKFIDHSRQATFFLWYILDGIQYSAVFRGSLRITEILQRFRVLNSA